MNNIIQHFRPEERPFVEKIAEWVRIVEHRNIMKRTDFLDPRQVEIVHAIVNRSGDATVFFNGGYSEAERVRAVIAPTFIAPEEVEFDLALIEIENLNPFSSLTHRDYLGALMNIGIVRDKFGDILVQPMGAQVVLCQEMVDYVSLHLHQIGRSTVRTKQIPISEIHLPEEEMEQKTITVASPRLDAVLSEIVRMSRAKVQSIIKNGKVKVNWKVIDSVAHNIQEGDLISIRGFGRVRILEHTGLTKKGNIVFHIGFYKEN